MSFSLSHFLFSFYFICPQMLNRLNFSINSSKFEQPFSSPSRRAHICFAPVFCCCVASYIFDFIRINCKEERRRLLLLASGFLCRFFHRKNDLFGENSLSIIEKKRKSRSRRTEQVEMSVYVRNNRESSPTKLK